MRVPPCSAMGSGARSALASAVGAGPEGSGVVGRNAAPWAGPPEACVEVSEPQRAVPGSRGEAWFVWQERPGQVSDMLSGASVLETTIQPLCFMAAGWLRVLICIFPARFFCFVFFYLMKTVCFRFGDQTLHNAERATYLFWSQVSFSS